MYGKIHLIFIFINKKVTDKKLSYLCRPNKTGKNDTMLRDGHSSMFGGIE